MPPYEPRPSVSESDLSDKPPFVINPDVKENDPYRVRIAQIRTLYSADDQVDRVMKQLQATGELDNALVVFTSDNGHFWAEHGLTSKFLPYREAVEVPIYLRWPGRVAAGAVDDRFVTQVDVEPTILVAAGLTSTPVPLDGKDFLGGHRRDTALIEYWHDTRNRREVPTWASIRSRGDDL